MPTTACLRGMFTVVATIFGFAHAMQLVSITCFVVLPLVGFDFIVCCTPTCGELVPRSGACSYYCLLGAAAVVAFCCMPRYASSPVFVGVYW